MRERLVITAELWGFRVRTVLERFIQTIGFAVLLFGTAVAFAPAVQRAGVPLEWMPLETLYEIYTMLGVHWIVLMVAGAATVWLTTR